jgi:hypothetical protein
MGVVLLIQHAASFVKSIYQKTLGRGDLSQLLNLGNGERAAASVTCSKTWEGGGFSATKVNFK